jgi:type VI secretion system protein VasD
MITVSGEFMAADHAHGQAFSARLMRRAVSMILLLLAASCSQPPPPPPPPTIVKVQVSATADANATAQGQGAPVTIRVYQLASKSAFEGAEFYRIFNGDAATLGADLVKKDEFLLAPGSSKSITLTPADNVHAIGVFAAYRDFQNVTWRADADIPAKQTTTVTVSADRTGIKLQAASAPPAGS